MRSAVHKRFFIFVLFFAICGAVVFYYHDSFVYKTSPSPFGTPKSGTLFYDRWRTVDEYTVLSGNGCKVINMKGEVIYRFMRLHCHFFSDGSMIMGNDLGYQYYGPLGENLWSVNEQLHHDLEVTPDEKEVYFLSDIFPNNKVSHLILGYNREGKEIFRWNAVDHLKEIEAIIGTGIGLNPTHFKQQEYLHLNTVQILPPNPLEKINPAFKRGNFLTNCFKINLAFIIDRETGKIVWHHSFMAANRLIEENSPPGMPPWNVTTMAAQDPQWKGTHTVRMLSDGQLLYFRNFARYQTPYKYVHFSSIEKMDPLTGKVTWSYHSDPVQNFFTYSQGATFLLKNGHYLVTNSHAGSVFEITPSGRVVWEWIGPAGAPLGLTENTLYRAYRVPKAQFDKVLAVWKSVK